MRNPLSAVIHTTDLISGNLRDLMERIDTCQCSTEQIKESLKEEEDNCRAIVLCASHMVKDDPSESQRCRR